jgi:hypothetical protein
MTTQPLVVMELSGCWLVGELEEISLSLSLSIYIYIYIYIYVCVYLLSHVVSLGSMILDTFMASTIYDMISQTINLHRKSNYVYIYIDLLSHVVMWFLWEA